MRFLAVSATALALLTGIPYLVGHRLDDASSSFLDTLVFEQDFNSYCAFVRQSAAGAWLFHNPFSPEPHRPVFLNLEFLVTGKAAGGLGVEPGLALQLQRVVAGALLALGLWGLGARVITTAAGRRLAFVAALTGGGFGWMQVLPGLGPLVARAGPVDLYAGVHPFFWLFLQPHFAVSEALVVLALWLLLEGERTGRAAFPLGAGVVAAVAGLVRPYDMLFLQVTSVLFAAASALRARKLETAATVRRRAWTAGETLMGCAAATSLILIYSYPWLRFSFQLVTTLVVPTLLLVFARLDGRMVASGTAVVLLAVNALMSVTLWATHLGEVVAGGHRIARSDLAAFSWLEAHSRPRDVVLAGSRTSNRVPRYTHDAVVAGYEFSTVRYAEKLARVRGFYDGSTEDAARRQLLGELRVRYVIHGPDERRLGAYQPSRSDFLRAVFRDGATSVYEVR